MPASSTLLGSELGCVVLYCGWDSAVSLGGIRWWWWLGLGDERFIFVCPVKAGWTNKILPSDQVLDGKKNGVSGSVSKNPMGTRRANQVT